MITIPAGAFGGRAGKVAVFATCYINYNEPGIGNDLLTILEHNEIPYTLVAGETCCGMPKLDGGDLAGARRLAERNVETLLPAVRAAPPESIHTPDHAYDDLLRYVLPRDPTVIGGASLRSVASRFTAASLGGGAYLGIALVVLLVGFGITERRRRDTWGLLAFILVSVLLTMGPALHVAGDRVSGLPTAVIWKLPLIKNAIPDRFPVHTDLAVAVVAALWLARARGPFACVGAVMLIPSISTPPWHAQDRTPAFFEDRTYASVLQPDENVLIIPTMNGEEMAWQATADFSFRMPEGYVGVIPTANRGSRLDRGLSSNTGQVPTTEELASWLNAKGVTAVVVDDLARPRFEAVLGSVGLGPVYEGDGVSVWRMRAAQVGSG